MEISYPESVVRRDRASPWPENTRKYYSCVEIAQNTHIVL